MSNDAIQNPFDIVAFTLAGNTLLTLNQKGILSKEEALKIIDTARFQTSQAAASRTDKEIGMDWHLDNLIAGLR